LLVFTDSGVLSAFSAPMAAAEASAPPAPAAEPAPAAQPTK
jgi:hypothetical protein